MNDKSLFMNFWTKESTTTHKVLSSGDEPWRVWMWRQQIGERRF